MCRLTRSKVLALRDQRVSVKEIAEKMRTTPHGICVRRLRGGMPKAAVSLEIQVDP